MTPVARSIWPHHRRLQQPGCQDYMELKWKSDMHFSDFLRRSQHVRGGWPSSRLAFEHAHDRDTPPRYLSWRVLCDTLGQRTLLAFLTGP